MCRLLSEATGSCKLPDYPAACMQYPGMVVNTYQAFQVLQTLPAGLIQVMLNRCFPMQAEPRAALNLASREASPMLRLTPSDLILYSAKVYNPAVSLQTIYMCVDGVPLL